MNLSASESRFPTPVLTTLSLCQTLPLCLGTPEFKSSDVTYVMVVRESATTKTNSEIVIQHGLAPADTAWTIPTDGRDYGTSYRLTGCHGSHNYIEICEITGLVFLQLFQKPEKDQSPTFWRFLHSYMTCRSQTDVCAVLQDGLAGNPRS